MSKKQLEKAVKMWKDGQKTQERAFVLSDKARLIAATKLTVDERIEFSRRCLDED